MIEQLSIAFFQSFNWEHMNRFHMSRGRVRPACDLLPKLSTGGKLLARNLPSINN
jgi:hypothetical protein